MADREVGTSGGCEPETDAVYSSKRTALSPAAPPSPPDIKIEMVQPKIEMVDFEGESNFDQCDPSIENDVDSKPDLTYIVAQERPICTGCVRSYENEDDLKCHLKYCGNSINDIVKFKCFHCLYETIWKDNLRKHIETRHLAQERERPICAACGKSLKNRDSLMSHLKYCEKWNSEIVKHECPICFYETKWKKNLTRHLRQVHSVETTACLTCNGCGQNFEYHDNLKVHMKQCDQLNKIVKHKCPICYYETLRKNHLTRHLRHVHSVGATESPTCPACGKSLKNEDSLKLHMKYCEKFNGEIIKYKCPICPYETKWRSTLTKHLRQVHLVGATERATCPGCGKSLKNKDSLRSHFKYCEKSNYGIGKRKSVGTVTERHICTDCGKSLKNKDSLRSHQKYCDKTNNQIEKAKSVETAERHNCPACGKSLKNKDSLRCHLKYCEKSSKKIVKHKCSICFYETKWKSHLAHHIRRVHSIHLLVPKEEDPLDETMV